MGTNLDKDQIKKFIEQLSNDELKQYVKGFIEKEDAAGRKLVEYITQQLNKVGLHNAEVSVDYSFKKTVNRGNRWNHIYVTDWESIEYDSHKLFERANNAIATGQPDIALTIATRWLEDFAESYDENEIYWFEEENEVYFMDTCEKAEKIILKAFNEPMASDAVKNNIKERINTLAQESGYIFSEYIDICELATRINMIGLSQEEALAYLNNELDEYPDDVDLIRKKYNLLMEMGRKEEALSILENNLHHHSIADDYINLLFKAKKFEKLIPLIKELMSQQENQKYYIASKTWHETLAKSQDALGLKEDATETYRQIFISLKGDLEYYRIIKQRVDPMKWPQYLDNMLKQTDFSGSFGGGEERYASILCEEGRFQELHDWLKAKNDIDHFSNFLRKIPKEYRTDLLPIYRGKILDMASHATKRKDYTAVCSYIIPLNRFQDGKKLAIEIASTLRAKYNKRPAFLEILGDTMREF